MHNKKLYIGLLTLFMILSILIEPMSGKINNDEVNINDVKENILNNNIELRKLDKEISINQHKYTQAIDNVESDGSISLDNYKTINQYYVIEAKMNLDYSQWQKTQKQKELVLQGEEYYRKLTLKNEEITLQNEKIVRLNNNLDNKKTKVALGQDVSSSITDIEISIKNEKLVLSKLEQEKQNIIMELNILMNSDLTIEPNLVYEDIPDSSIQIELETSIKNALQNNGDILKAKTQIELSDIVVNYYNEVVTRDEDETPKLNSIDDKTQTELDFQDSKITVEYNIRSQYNTVLNAKDSVDIARLQLESLNIELESEQKRLEVGLSTQPVVDNLTEQVAFAKLNLKTAQLEYYVTLQKLKSLI